MAPQDFPHLGTETGRGRIDYDSGDIRLNLAQLFPELSCEVSGQVCFGGGRVCLRGGNGVDIPIEADNPRELMPEALGEKARATIGVDQNRSVSNQRIEMVVVVARRHWSGRRRADRFVRAECKGRPAGAERGVR